MTTEEKAKAYDEALKRASHVKGYKTLTPQEAAEYIFPQLHESEDEQTRKRLIEFISDIKRISESGRTVWAVREDDVEMCNSFLAYLEKQKEVSKAIEAVERIDKYIDEHVANAHYMKDSNPDKKYYRGWDDALGKLAGILQDVYSGEKKEESLRDFIDDFPYSAEQEEQKPTISDEAIRDGVVNFGITQYQIDNWLKKHINIVEQKPAEWNVEDKSFYDSIMCEVVKEGMHPTPEQANWFKLLPERFDLQLKQGWTEEDKEKLNSIFNTLHCIGKFNFDSWIKSLPERFNLQTKQEWSEENDMLMDELESYILYDKEFNDEQKSWRIKRLKSLCLQTKQEWSKEDEERYISCLKRLGTGNPDQPETINSKWFKEHVYSKPYWKPSEQEKGALRTAIYVLTEERNFPKAASHLQAILDAFDGNESRKDWKPSEEQMEALRWVAYENGNSSLSPYSVSNKNLASLYEELKKLGVKEEPEYY